MDAQQAGGSVVQVQTAEERMLILLAEILRELQIMRGHLDDVMTGRERLRVKT